MTTVPKNKVMYGLDASKYPSRMGESAKTLRLETKEALKVTTTEKDPEDGLPSMLEVVTLLKDIQRKLNLILEKVE